MKLLKYIAFLIPSISFAQKVDTIKVKKYKTDTSKVPYEILMYISIDTAGETIYRRWYGTPGESKTKNKKPSLKTKRNE